MSTVDRGHARERQFMKRLQDEGWFACRPRWAGVDIVALKAGERPRFYEVKANRGSPYMHFRREDRELLLLAAEKAGADAYLVWWPPGKGQVAPKVLHSDEWPTPSDPSATIHPT